MTRISQLVRAIVGADAEVTGAEILRRHLDRYKLGVPFRRAHAFQDAVREIFADSLNHVVGMSGALNQRGQQLLREIGEYRSRGHGRGTPIGRGYAIVPITPATRTLADDPYVTGRATPASRSKYLPHQGRRERDRRRVGGYGYARRAHAFYLTEPYSREHS